MTYIVSQRSNKSAIQKVLVRYVSSVTHGQHIQHSISVTYDDSHVTFYTNGATHKIAYSDPDLFDKIREHLG